MEEGVYEDDLGMALPPPSPGGLGSSADFGGKTSGPLPGYLQPTFSSKTTSYLHAEVERVTNSYRTGSFWSLKKLPDKIEPGKIQTLRIKWQNDNLAVKSNNFVVRSSPSSLPSNRLEYIGTDYHKNEFINRQNLEENRLRLEGSSKKAFFPASNRIKDKFEDIFENPNFQYPYMGPSKGALQFDRMLRNGKSYTDDDLPGKGKHHKHKTSGETNKEEGGQAEAESEIGSPKMKKNDKDFYTHNAKEWAQKIYSQLSIDWPHMKFKMRFIEQGELLVQFDISAFTSGDGRAEINASIHKYMSTLIAHGIAAECGMVKRGDRWGVVEFDVFRRSKPDHKESGQNQLDTTDKSDAIPLLTYSMVAPWVKSVGLEIKKSTSERLRSLARESYFDEENKRRATVINAQVDTYGTTISAMKQDVKNLPFNPTAVYNELSASAAAAAAAKANEPPSNISRETADYLVIKDKTKTFDEKLQALGLKDLFLDGKTSLSAKALRDPKLAANAKMLPKPTPLPGQNIERWRVPLDFDLFDKK